MTAQASLFGQDRAHWSTPLGAPNGAHLSICGRYRTMLWRTLDEFPDARPLVFGMLNPSTADAQANDPTITRCLGFARREKAGGIVVVNASPWRATDPRDLWLAWKRGEDVGRRGSNDAAWQRAFALGPAVMAWGASAKGWLGDLAMSMAFAAAIRGQPLCLGKTKTGEPRHPLMLRADTPLEPWP